MSLKLPVDPEVAVTHMDLARQLMVEQSCKLQAI